MRAPDYRKAACCGNCYYYAMIGFKCIKYSEKADLLDVCAHFATKEEIEGAESEV